MIVPLQRTQNAAARLVTGIGFREHDIPASQQLHWLPAQYCIIFKLCILMHKTDNKQAPSYISNKVTANTELRFRAGLRSTSTNTRHQGHVLSLASEVFPIQDQLHGTLYDYHIMFVK